MIDTSWKSNEQYVRNFAWKVWQRAYAAGLKGIDLEDVVQEFVFPWMKAVEKYDPEGGVPFRAFLMRGLKLHANRWIENQMRDFGATPYSLDYEIGGEGGESMSLGDAIQDESVPQLDEELGRVQFFEQLMTRLDERARIFVRLLMQPPVELFEELDAMRAQAELSRQNGRTSFCPTQITAALIFALMGASSVERVRIKKSILTASEQLTAGRV